MILGLRAWWHYRVLRHRVSGEILPDITGRRRVFCGTCLLGWSR